MCAFVELASWVLAILLRRPSQPRLGGREAVGLCGAVDGALATKVDMVGIAVALLVEKCPSGRGGRFWRKLSGQSDMRRFLSGDWPVSCVSSTLTDTRVEGDIGRAANSRQPVSEVPEPPRVQRLL